MPKAKRHPRLTEPEHEMLLNDALGPYVGSEAIHEHVYHSSAKFRRAEEMLSREGLLDERGELSHEAMRILVQIEAKTRPVGTPLENAIVEVSHMRRDSEGPPWEGLIAKGLMNDDLDVTNLGWEVVLGSITTRFLKAVTENWRSDVSKALRERDSLQQKWQALDAYVGDLHPAPKHPPIVVNGPPRIAQEADDLLKLARLCILVGAWAGAVQYCSTAVEGVTVSVLVSKGLRKPFEDLPALQELAGELGKRVPEVSPLTKRLVSVISNFRNDAVHPREPQLRPGESQARLVYDMTLRFLAEIRPEWFEGLDRR